MNELRRAAGRMVLAGFAGTSLPEDVARTLRDDELLGVILFRRNLGDIDEIAALNREIHATRPAFTPLIAIDQEGGLVQRIKAPFPHWPPMMDVAQTQDADYVAKVGEAIGDELASLGFNLNFAPCTDIHTNDANPIIGRRAFGTTPEDVTRYAGAFAAGMIISGVTPCLKHFPGHGDTHTDSHLELPVLHTPLDVLRARELRPFRELLRAQIPMVMTAHILFPELDDTLPATLSPRIISELLRVEMGFDGVVISDDLNMKALADHYDIPTMVDLGLRAGIDIFLICEHTERQLEVYENLVKQGEKDSLQRARILQAAKRVEAMHRDWIRPWQMSTPLLDSAMLDAHHHLAARAKGGVASTQ